MRIIKETSKYAIFGVLEQVGRALRIGGVPVLAYHSLDDLGSTMSMPPRSFRRQMQYLKRVGFSSILLSELVEDIRAGRPLREDSFVLTFDDGFRNVYEVAFPILQELDFTATVFPVTGYMGTTCGWDVGHRNRRVGAHRLELLTWRQVDEMSRRGFEFGSHGAGHLRLTEISSDAVRDDLKRSKAELEDRLGCPCPLFCYPYGEVDEPVRDIVRQTGFVAAATLWFGRTVASSDLYSLPRVGSARFTNMQVFKACMRGTYGWHLRRKRNRR